MDDSSVQKLWERPWTTEEMRAHCSNWNLGGDAGLLKHLQDFSQNLMQKTHTAEVALDSLLEDMRNTSVDVQNATNALLMISNNQFVENRVYDDCEDEKEEMEAKSDDDKTSSSATVNIGESALISKAAEAILLGMSVIDTKFDCVEVPASDSEGEEDERNPALNGRKSFALVLEPRNPYALQPLPHLIGSKEFMEDDRVGLGGDDEDEEEEEEDDDDDVHLSVGQDLVAQRLNDSGSSLAGDMGDEGLFDDDEVEDRRVHNTSVKQEWESSSSNGSDDLVVESNAIRKKQKRNVMMDPAPLGHGEAEEDEDIFGGRDSAPGEEFGVSSLSKGEPPMMPKKSYKEEDFNDEVVTNPETVNQKLQDDVFTKKKPNSVKSTVSVPKTHSITSDNLFGPPKDEWKDDDHDGDSIFAATDGIFSGGDCLFDDFEDPFMAGDRLDVNRVQPPNFSDKPPAFKGVNDDSAVPEGGKGDIFGADDDEQDVFANILVKMKPPQQSKSHGEAPRKQLAVPENTCGKDSKGLGTEGTDSWLFDDADQGDSLWNVEAAPRKDKEIMEDGVREQEVPKTSAVSDSSKRGDMVEEEVKETTQQKLPVGARSFYAGGIDPFALGKKLTKELEDKRKMKQERGNDGGDTGKMDFNGASHERKDKPDVKGGTPEKKRVKELKNSPESGSLFDGMDEGDDLFAPVNIKQSSPREVTSSNKDDLFDDSLFTFKKNPAISKKIEDSKRKLEKKTSGSDIDISKNLFGGFASDDDDIFSSSNSLGSRSSASKALPSKGKKAFIDSCDPLFDDDGLGEDGELFPGSLRRNIFSENKVDDDLFSGFNKNEEGKSVERKKKESSSSSKTEFQPPLTDGSKNDDGDTGKAANLVNKNSDSQLGPLDVISSEKKGLKALEKVESIHGSKNIPTSYEKSKNEFDDIFGDLNGKLSRVDVTKRVADRPSVETLSGVIREDGKKVTESNPYEEPGKGKALENLFDDFGNDEDFLSNEKDVLSKSVQSPIFEANSLQKKKNGKNLFSEFDSDGDDQKFSTPKGGKLKTDSLYDPLSQEDDDLFSNIKQASQVKKTQLLLNDDSLTFSFASDRKKSEPYADDKGDSQGGRDEGGVVVPGPHTLPVGGEEEGSGPSLASGGVSMRKSPPKTLNLEKVIPSPKPDNKVLDLDDDFLSSNDAEEDKIMQAWMKGQPPPLRDSKVETAMEDEDLTPGYTPAPSYESYGPSKSDGPESYFADMPSASLLRSHGKERARIPCHRRPPSRKVRKGSTASVDPLPVTVEDEAKLEPASNTFVLPSRDSVEEDGGSQGTIEEWSTPEAALTSPPHTLTATSAPPCSNPLSPSTDEEQDFFDVLPVGHHYPPPMDPPSHLSPFSDALGGIEDVWERDDSALFEDAQPMEQGGGGLWGSGDPPATPPGCEDEWKFPSEDVSKAKQVGYKSEPRSVTSLAGKEKEYDDSSSKAVQGSVTGGAKTKGELDSNFPKKVKPQRKQESGKLDDDLWGNGFSSRLKDDIFAEGFRSTQSGDFDDLFQGQGDLFGPSRVSLSTQETKKVTVGSISDKGMGKSLSKLDSKPKAPGSLFDDDDDDSEDLFSPHSSQPAPRRGSNTTRKTNATRSAVSEQSLKSSLLKVAADDSIFEDPLMVLKKPE